MFRVDFKRLIADLLPLWLRRPLVFGILRAGLIGIEDVYNMFSASRRDDNFRLTHNGQVCHLRGMLNSCFGMGFGIGDVRSDGEWLFAVGEDGVHIPLASGEDGVDVPVVYSGQALNGEFYASLPYNFMVQDGLKVWVPTNVDYFCQWGTPEDMREFVYWTDLIRHRDCEAADQAAAEAVKSAGKVLIPMAGAGQRFAGSDASVAQLCAAGHHRQHRHQVRGGPEGQARGRGRPQLWRGDQRPHGAGRLWHHL